MKNNFVLFSVLLMIFSCRGQSLIIAYSGNLNGYLEPCDCQEANLGGMTRFITAVDSLRQIHPDLLLLDSGDFLKSYPLAVANWLMLQMLADLNYDALTLGDQEFVEGVDFLIKGIHQFQLPVLAGNLAAEEFREGSFSAFKIVQKNDLKIALIAAVDSGCFSYAPQKQLIIYPVQEILQKSIAGLRTQVDVLILLYHTSFEQALRIAENYPEIDIIIAGDGQERMAKMIGERQMVVQSGYDGEYLGILEVNFQDADQKYRNCFLPISEGFVEDTTFKNEIRLTFMEIENIR